MIDTYFINPLNINIMTKEKRQAVHDIQEECQRQGKCFLAFHEELDPVIEHLVDWYYGEEV